MHNPCISRARIKPNTKKLVRLQVTMTKDYSTAVLRVLETAIKLTIVINNKMIPLKVQ